MVKPSYPARLGRHLLVAFGIIFALTRFASAAEIASAPQQTLLAEERQALQILREQISVDAQELPSRISKLTPGQATDAVLQAARLATQAAQIEVEKTKAALTSAQTAVREQAQLVASEQKRLGAPAITVEPTTVTVAPGETNADLQAQLVFLTQTLHQEQDAAEQLALRLELQRKQLETAERWEQALQLPNQLYQQQQLIERIRTERQRYLDEAEQLKTQWQRLQWLGDAQQARLHQVKIQLAEVRADLASHALRYNYTQTQIQNWRALLNQTPQQITAAVVSEAQQLRRQVQISSQALDQQAKLLRQQAEILRQTTATLPLKEHVLIQEEQQLLTQLEQALTQQIVQFTSLQPGLNTLQQALAAAEVVNFQAQLHQRRSLPQTWEGWVTLVTELSRLPERLYQQAAALYQFTVYTLSRLSPDYGLLIILMTLAWGGIAFQGRYYLKLWWQQLSPDRPQLASVATLLLFVLIHNMLALWLALGLSLLLVWLNPDAPLQRIGWLIAFTPLALRLLPTLLFGVLCEGLTVVTPDPTRQLSLYRRLTGLWWLGSGIGTLTLTAHLLLLSQEVRDLLDTIFMISLISLIWPFSQMRRFLLDNWHRSLPQQWQLILSVSSFFLLTVALIVATLGTLGYLQLGWFLAQHLGILFILLVLWLVLRGLLLDALGYLQSRLAQHNRLAGFLAEDLLPLLSVLLRLMLLSTLVYSLFFFNNWLDDQAVLALSQQFLLYPIYATQDIHLTVSSILLAGLTLWLVIWMSRLLKRISYWLLYENVEDLGVRSSLANFTQYTLIFLGFVIALQVMGVNLTTLIVVLGGLGVGIGFGLQNVANNFVSGILLLIERPVRTGDIVNIAGQEGRITALGIRSVTLKNWDMHDVIIPNSELISQAFTNFTLSDQTLRLLLTVGISYDADPQQAKKLMQEVVYTDSSILKQPEPMVIFWEYGDSALIFKLYLYVDISKNNLLLVRDRVLFTLWDRLKAAGITIPYPQRDVYLKSLPPSLSPVATPLAPPL